MKRLAFVGLCLLLLVRGAAAQESLAITEFMNQPVGESNGRQWVELYNYGTKPVKTAGWQLSNSTDNVIDIPDVTIPSGGYAIVVLGHGHLLPARDKKEMFEIEWLGGKSDDRVVGVSFTGYTLRPGDDIILKSAKRIVAWKVGYKNDGKPGHATFLTLSKQFNWFPRQYGSREQPGIDRKGQDLNVTGGEFLGYEGNAFTKDPAAYESDVSGLEKEWGEAYKSVAKGGMCGPGTGSPLKGNYTPKK